jgi:Fic family protein
MDMSEIPARQEVIYHKSNPLESIFRNATSRVLDFLILNPKFDYSASEISNLTQIPIRTLQRVLPNLVEKRLLTETGKVGNTRMYMLNPQSELAQLLKEYVSKAMNVAIDEAKKYNTLR